MSDWKSYEKDKTKRICRGTFIVFLQLKLKFHLSKSLIQTSIMDIAMSISNSDWTTLP